MNKQLEGTAREYVEKAEDIFQFILELLDVKDKYELAQLVREKNDTTFLVDEKKYIIGTHGRGCFFSNGKDEIDWNFGDNRICGIDCWMLANYIKFYYPKLSEELSFEKIKLEFEDAYRNDEIDKRYDLYYFKD